MKSQKRWEKENRKRFKSEQLGMILVLICSRDAEATLFAEPILAAGRSSPCDATSGYV